MDLQFSIIQIHCSVRCTANVAFWSLDLHSIAMRPFSTFDIILNICISNFDLIYSWNMKHKTFIDWYAVNVLTIVRAMHKICSTACALYSMLCHRLSGFYHNIMDDFFNYFSLISFNIQQWEGNMLLFNFLIFWNAFSLTKKPTNWTVIS